MFLAAAVAMPLAIGAGNDCPGLGEGELTGDCTITGDLELAGSLLVPKGTKLMLQDATIRFTDTENPPALVVSGTFRAQGSAIEAAEDVDLTVRFTSESSGKLEDSSLMGTLALDETARLEVYRSVRVVANLAGAGPAGLTVRDARDDVRATSVLGHEEDELLLLLVQTHEGAEIERLDPYRFILKAGSAADHAELEIGANQDDVVLVLDDDDRDPPEWGHSPLQQDGPRPGFSRDGSVALAWEPADDTLGGGQMNRAVSHYRILLNGEELVERVRATSATIEDLAEGEHAFIVQAVDLVGNSGTSNPVTVHVDRTPPTVDFAAETTEGAIAVTVTAREPGEQATGLMFLRWRIGDGPTTIVEGGGASLEDSFSLGSGSHEVVVITEDLAGHRVEEVQEFVMDTSAPTFLARLEPRLPVGTWHREAPELIVDVLDPGPSGPGAIHYRMGDGGWQEYTNPTALDAPGEHRVQVRVADAAGNEAITQLRMAHDAEPPTIQARLDGPPGSGGWFVGPVRLEASAADSASGVERLEQRIAQGAWRPFDPLLLESSGEHQVALRATDAAGNQVLHALTVSIDGEVPTPPIVSWMAKEGRVQGDWSRAPPADGVSGIADIVVERAGFGDSNLGASAKGHSMELPNGDNRLRVRLVDVAGNEAVTEWETVTVANSTVGAESAKKVRGEVVLRPDSLDGVVEARFFVDGTLLDATATEPFAITWQTQGLKDGLHAVRVVAVDEQGLHHEELRTYNVRNGYAAVLADEAVPAGLAFAASIGALAVASVGFVRWRRWTL